MRAPPSRRRSAPLTVLLVLSLVAVIGGGDAGETDDPRRELREVRHRLSEINDGRSRGGRRRRRLASASALERACRPRHVHLSVGERRDDDDDALSSMTVSFSSSPDCADLYRDFPDDDSGDDPRVITASPSPPPPPPVGAVRFGLDPDRLTRLAITTAAEGDGPDGDGVTMSYNASLTPHQKKEKLRRAGKSGKKGDGEELLLYFSDAFHHVRLGNLKPATRYYYRCETLPPPPTGGDGAAGGADVVLAEGRVHTFVTPPAPGEWFPSGGTVKFALVGDLGARPHSQETVTKLEENRVHDGPGRHGRGVDLLLICGDISYANNDHSVWDDWFDMMSDAGFFAEIPTQVALGNHDVDYDAGTREVALAYERRFRMPRVWPAQRGLAGPELFNGIQTEDYLPYEFGNAYYSFEYGPSYHVVLSSYSSHAPGSAQRAWLESELNSVDRGKFQWIIVTLHCPLYNTFASHRNDRFLVDARANLEPLFVRYTVNFVFSGHVHSYMRTSPVRFGRSHPRGPIHVIQGNGGRNANAPYHNDTPEEWVGLRDHSMYGYGTLELLNTTHARWEWIKSGYNALGEGGKFRYEPDHALHDSLVVTNQLYVLEEERPNGGGNVMAEERNT